MIVKVIESSVFQNQSVHASPLVILYIVEFLAEGNCHKTFHQNKSQLRQPNVSFLQWPFRHLLLSGGPVFTEDLWLIVSEGLREAVHTTLSNLRDMVACFQPGSFSVNGDEGMTVRVVARRDVITADMIRLQQVAEQVRFKRGISYEEHFHSVLSVVKLNSKWPQGLIRRMGNITRSQWGLEVKTS